MKLLRYEIFRQGYRGKQCTVFCSILFGLAVIVFQSSAPLMGKLIFDKALPTHNYYLILRYGLIWLVCLSSVSIFQYLYDVFITEADCEAARKLKIATLRAVLLRFHEDGSAGKKQGELLSHLLTDTQEFIDRAGLGCIIEVACAAVAFVVVTALMFVLDWPMAIMCIAGTIGSLALQYRVPRRLKQSNQKVAFARAYATSVIENIIAAWSTIVRHHKIEKEVAYSDRAVARLSDSKKSAKRKMYVARLQNSLLTNALPIILIWIGAFRMASGKIGLGTLIAFVSYLYLMGGSLSNFFRVGIDIFSGFGQANTFMQILNESANTEVLTGHFDQPSGIDTITIKNMTLTADKFVLKANQIVLSEGKIYLLNGESGVGKSTFLEFLAGIRKADQAEIYINKNRCDTDRFSQIAKNFGYVRKEEVLLDRSVAENIYGLSESNSKNIENHIQILKMDYFSRQNITGLSAGEKQRLAFIRELVRKPKLFIIDEGTDSLDENLKINVFRLVKEVLPKCILVICTHNWQNNTYIDGKLIVSNGYVCQENAF